MHYLIPFTLCPQDNLCHRSLAATSTLNFFRQHTEGG